MSLPILIIGAGLAGLSLAQSLKQHSIPYVVFERDSSHAFRAQGYRIRISQAGGDALRSLLPSDLFDLFDRTAAPVVPGMHGYDAVTGEIPAPQPGGRRPPPWKGQAWNADRTVLRDVLLRGLDVRFGKKFTRYELTDGGAGVGVVAHFADGSSVEGAMLVGADGSSSRVRKQLVPEAVLFDTEGRAVFGKTPIAGGRPEGTKDSIEGGINLIRDTRVPGSQVSLFCDIMKFDRGRVEEGMQIPEDYIYWVLLFKLERAGMPDSELMRLSSAASAQLAEKLTGDWHESNRAIVAGQKVDAASTLALLMRSPEMEGWKSDCRVTMLGDAAHLSIPVGGIGANSALQDAAELAAVLTGEKVDTEAVAAYESNMLNRAREALRMISGGGNFFDMKPFSELKPVQPWS